MLSPVVYGSFWKSEMVLQTTSVFVLCSRVIKNGNINFVRGEPVSLEKRDEVKLRERLVEGSGSLVGNHEEGVVAACAADAYKLPQSLQEVVRPCGGQEN